jgi:hypothetical protein
VLAVVLAAVLAAGGLASCADPPPTPEGGTFRVRSAMAGEVPQGLGLVIEAAAPCRLALRVDGAAPSEAALPPRPVAAGRTGRVWWLAEVLPAVPRAADGGTPLETWTVRLVYGVDGGPAEHRTITVDLPVGRGVTVRRDPPPPPVGEEVRLGDSLDLVAIGVADGGGGAPAIVGRGDRTRLSVPGGGTGAILRLSLEIRAP